MRFGILKLTLSFLLCFMINLSAQTKEELKTVKKVLKQEKKMEHNIFLCQYFIPNPDKEDPQLH